MAHEYKTVPAIAIKIDSDLGIVEHLISVFGVLDEGQDIVHPGSFAKTITERASKIRVLDQHNAGSVHDILGKPISMREVGRDGLPVKVLQEYPEATGGVIATTQFFLDTPEGLGAFTRIKNGGIDEYSYAYDALDTDMEKVKDKRGNEVTARNIRTLKLYEYSPVIFAMNSATATIAAKSVSGKMDLPLAPRDRDWDADAAEGRVRSWAGAEETPNAKYRQAFFWYDADNPDLFTSYKLGFADVIDGELHAVPPGIFACAGGRGVNSADIPESDKATIKQKITSYYKRMASEFEDDEMMSPFEKSAGKTKHVKQESLTDFIDDVGRAFSEQYSTPNSYAYVREVFDDFAIVFIQGGKYEYYRADYTRDAEGHITFASRTEWAGGDYAFIPGAKSMLISLDKKVGRVLAQRNANRIQEAMRLLHDAMMDAGLLEEEEEHAPEKAATTNPDKAGEAGPEASTHLELQMLELEQKFIEME